MTASTVTASFIAAIGLALAQLLIGRLGLIAAVGRRTWTSFAAGVSVAYVFAHLLPELFGAAARHGRIEQVSITVLLGFTVAYAAELLARATPRGSAVTPSRGDADAATRVFWLHLASFALYNALIGLLLIDLEAGTVAATATFAVAMAFHIGVNDTGLRQYHHAPYDRVGRPVLAAAVPVGWTVGYVTPLAAGDILVPGALLAGGIILNSIRIELPAGREARLTAFLLGAALYAAVLLLV